jgi:hypothetical protein
MVSYPRPKSKNEFYLPQLSGIATECAFIDQHGSAGVHLKPAAQAPVERLSAGAEASKADEVFEVNFGLHTPKLTG